jgi:IS5 family transposase
MHPSRSLSGRNDLFRERLDAIINPRHPLVRLSELMAWDDFDKAFGRFYRPVGRPAKPTRLMVGLHYLKHVPDLSEEEVVVRWVENVYWSRTSAQLPAISAFWNG